MKPFKRTLRISLAAAILACSSPNIAKADDAADLAKLKQQVTELQAQLGYLQAQSNVAAAQATLAQAKADAAQAGMKETVANQALIATSQATIAQQNRNAVNAAFPTNLVTPLNGSITVDSAHTFPPKLLTYAASDRMASEIIDGIVPILKANMSVAIYAESDLSLDLQATYKTVDASLNNDKQLLSTQSQIVQNYAPVLNDFKATAAQAAKYIQKAKANEATEAIFSEKTNGFLAGMSGADTALASATSTLQAAIQLISLFRTDTSIVGVATDTDVEALESQLCFHLLFSDGKKRSPALVVSTPAALIVGDSQLLKDVRDLNQALLDASKVSDQIKKSSSDLAADETKVEGEIKKQVDKMNLPQKEATALTQDAQSIAKKEAAQITQELANLTKNITDLVNVSTALANAIQTPDPKTGVVPLANLAKTEALLTGITNSTYSLIVKPVAAGGATRTDRNLITGAKLTQLGGAIFIVTLVRNSSHQIVYSNTSKGFVGFTKLANTTTSHVQDIKSEKHFLWWHWPDKSSQQFTMQGQ